MRYFLLVILFLTFLGKVSFSQVSFFSDLGYSYFTAPDTLINSHAITLTPRLNYGLSKTKSISISSELSIGSQIDDFIGSISQLITWNTPILVNYNSGIAASKPKKGSNSIGKSDKSSFGYFAGIGAGNHRMNKEIHRTSGFSANRSYSYLENIAIGIYISTGIRFKLGDSIAGLRFNFLYPLNESEDYATKMVFGTGIFVGF